MGESPELQRVLGCADHVEGPSASGEYSARCPCHDDKTASLSIRQKAGSDGVERIMVHCHAGCLTSDILKVWGLGFQDLVVGAEDRGPAKPRRQQKPRPQPQEPAHDPALPGVDIYQAQPAKEKPQERDRIDWDHPDRVYSYTDETGAELFQVVRLHYLNRPGKTFRQRRCAPGDPKANRDGYVNSVPDELRNRTLYRLPRVIQGIRDGRTVFVVEGEKDVETLERLGYVATCNPGGAGKWRREYAERLRDADVIILPDNDTAANEYTGQKHAYTVALSLQGIAKRVRLVDLAECCAQLPAKGDISDLVQILGDTEGMDALARQIAATRDFDPNDVPFWLTPLEQARMLYQRVKGYDVKDGAIVQITADTTRPLCDFVVIPRMELTRDDGVNQSMWFVLDGWGQGGRRLGRVTIGSKDLDSMGWVTAKWGFTAAMAPGTATKDKLAWAIKKVGQMTAQNVTEYNHTGWRQIRGKWCYLYHGGAVGMEGVTVDMGDALKTYRLDGGGAPGFDQITPMEAVRDSAQLQTLFREDIGIALLGTVYLAPLREFLNQMDIVPAFALYLYGESGTHKTTAAALALSHFGNFHAKNPPASFADTGNQIRKKAFLVKDAPLLVDDYHPVSSVQEKRQMAATAQALSRAFGDGSDRGRLNADATIKASTPPRSVAMITGEDLPAIGASGLARFFILDIDKEDIPVTRQLTDAQERARRGTLQKAMRGYIEYLLPRVDTLPEKLHGLFLTYREIFRKGGSQHDRAPESTACILIGYHMMLEYMHEVGLYDKETCLRMLEHAQAALTRASSKQSRDMEAEKPTRIYLDALSELAASGDAVFKNLLDDAAKLPANKTMIGYMDREWCYLLPNVAFGAVSKLCREQGVEFPVSLKALYKHLRTDGILSTLGGEAPTKNKWIDAEKRAVRLLWIPRKAILGTAPDYVQLGMTEVAEDDLPFD